MDVGENVGKCFAYLVDLGQTELVSNDKVFHLPRVFLKLPLQLFRVKLNLMVSNL